MMRSHQIRHLRDFPAESASAPSARAEIRADAGGSRELSVGTEVRNLEAAAWFLPLVDQTSPEALRQVPRRVTHRRRSLCRLRPAVRAHCKVRSELLPARDSHVRGIRAVNIRSRELTPARA